MSQAKSNKMGVVQLTILTMVNMMGSGIIMLPTKLAEVGTISIISWLVTAVGSMALAWAFAKCGMFSRKSGGMGGYAEYAFGKSGNFMANYTYGVSLLIANVAIAISAVGYGTELLGASLSPVQIGLATIGVLWICTVANFGGARITGQISSITVWGVIIPVVGLCIIGWFWFSPTLYVDSWNPHHAPFFSAVGSSIAMTLWAFLGLESACANTDVVENPERNVPIAVLGGPLLALFLWLPQWRSQQHANLSTSRALHTRGIWRSPLAWQVTLFLGINSLVYYVIIGWLPAILISHGYSEAQAGSLHGLLQLATAAPGLLIPLFLHHVKDQRGIAAFVALMCAVGAVGLCFMPAHAITWTLLFGFGSGATMILGLTFIGLRASSAHQAAALSGMAQSVGYLLAACGPPLMGKIHDANSDWSVPLLGVAILSLLMAIFGLCAGRDKEIR